MSVTTLVRRNVLDPYRSRSLWFLLALFVLVFGLIGYMLGGSQTVLSFVVVTIMGQLAPLAALAMAYGAIAGPRESGSLRVLLSYPYTRRELVLGTLVGRIIVVGAAVLLGILAGVVSAAIFGGTVDARGTLVVAALSVVLSTTFVGIAMGISASVASEGRAAIGAFGAYLIFTAFWGLIPTLVRYVLNGFAFPTGQAPEWVAVWEQLSPTQAYQTAAAALTQDAGAGDPVYTTAWFAVVVLVAWFVLAIAVGLLRFERTDL